MPIANSYIDCPDCEISKTGRFYTISWGDDFRLQLDRFEAEALHRELAHALTPQIRRNEDQVRADATTREDIIG
jgi:hypothetical protein